MPLVKRSNFYRRPWFLLNAHMETIIPSIFFKIDNDPYSRERLEMDDGDFLDLDWIKSMHNRRLLIISHGLEGSSERYYVKRPAIYFSQSGWDVLAWNCRSCSGVMNRLPRFYHHGDTDDLARVVDQALSKNYDSVVLMGFSMGGSMSIKYLGERNPDPSVSGAITFSVPCDLKDSSDQLEKNGNAIYRKRFLSKLRVKMQTKAVSHPDHIDVEGIDDVRDFDTFHERFTAPLHGFDSVSDFFTQATCGPYLESLSRPVLVGNALNDPLLGPACYPFEAAKRSKQLFLETPRSGGHVGFTMKGTAYSWMELRAETFIDEIISR